MADKRAAARDGDKQWGEFGRQSREAAKVGDWKRIKEIYLQQIDFLHKENRDSSHIKSAYLLCDAQEAASRGAATHVQIITSRDDRVCEKCRALEGKEYTIDEVVKLRPLPIKCATEYPCRCNYIILKKTRTTDPIRAKRVGYAVVAAIALLLILIILAIIKC